MVFIDLKHGTFFPINPYEPTAPTDQEQQLGYRIAVAIADEFGLRKPVVRSPDYCHRLLAQGPAAYINWGCMIIYMVTYSFESLSKHYIGDLLPNSIGKCRSSWFYHASFEEKYVFSLLLTNKRTCQRIKRRPHLYPCKVHLVMGGLISTFVLSWKTNATAKSCSLTEK